MSNDPTAPDQVRQAWDEGWALGWQASLANQTAPPGGKSKSRTVSAALVVVGVVAAIVVAAVILMAIGGYIELMDAFEAMRSMAP